MGVPCFDEHPPGRAVKVGTLVKFERVRQELWEFTMLQDAADHATPLFERAEQAAQKALDADPDNPPYTLWSHISKMKNDTDKAILYGEKAVKQAPNRPGPYFMYGQALSHGERFEEAVSTYETALELNPVQSEALEMLRRLGGS